MKFARVLAPFISALALACTNTQSASTAPLPSAAATAPSRIANLHAFARLYGVVRWFYPGDAAAATDWNRLAIDGTRRVADARSPAELRDHLRSMFGSIAPAVQIAGPGEPLVDVAVPANTKGLDLVAWEHLGYGDTTFRSAYLSKRRHRDATVPADGDPFAAVNQSIDATPYRGLPIRLRAKLRASAGSHAAIWLRVDRHGGATGFFDNMLDRPVTTTTWTPAEITGTVDADADRIVFGPLLDVDGTAWFDALQVEVQRDGRWAPIEVADPGFESDAARSPWGYGVRRERAAPEGWEFTRDPQDPAEGKQAFRIDRKFTQLTEELFDDAPRAGEYVDLDLGQGLRARVPLSLYSRDGHTIDAAPVAVAPPAGTTVVSPAAAAAFDPLAGAADVLVTWNVFQHFWPYWDLTEVDWNQALDRALADALDDRTAEDLVTTLRRLTAQAPDGHVSVGCPGTTPVGSLPVVLDVVEGRLIVTASGNPALSRGDEILAVDGADAMAMLTTQEALASGSPQWRRVRALPRVGQGPRRSHASLRVRHGDRTIDVDVARIDEELEPTASRSPIEQLEQGIWYVDMDRASMAEIDAAMPKLAAARGVVVDLRGYPNSNHALLLHLLDKPEHARWMHIAHVIRPDHVAPPAWNDQGWDLAPAEPHLANVVFLTGPGAISYAESVMGYVETTTVPIVGAATAGTNGNVARITAPTGCTVFFTGMRVDKHDGKRFHLIGVPPTVPVTPTIAGIRDGRDEVLEAGIAKLLGKK